MRQRELLRTSVPSTLARLMIIQVSGRCQLAARSMSVFRITYTGRELSKSLSTDM